MLRLLVQSADSLFCALSHLFVPDPFPALRAPFIRLVPYSLSLRPQSSQLCAHTALESPEDTIQAGGPTRCLPASFELLEL
jgi:hypothetical protein